MVKNFPTFFFSINLRRRKGTGKAKKYQPGGTDTYYGNPGKLAENRKLSLKKERGKLFAHKLGKEMVSFLFNRINGHIFAITVEN